MFSASNKYEYYEKIKAALQQNGFLVEDSSDINYGLQFNAGVDGKRGLIRIYESKKGIKCDFSQIKDISLLEKIEGCINFGSETSKQQERQSIESSKCETNFPKEIIGTDESGKGDFFGPLVVASVYVDQKTTNILKSFGVTDSKKLSDKQIHIMAKEIKAVCPNSLVVIGNQKYNELYKKINNLNKLLAWGHARGIENILEKINCDYALSDQFGDEQLITKALLEKGRKITLYQRPKAEENIAVAAASILARNEYVIRLKQLSDKYGLSFPKGASKSVVDVARRFIDKYSKDELVNVSKLHFKTTEQL